MRIVIETDSYRELENHADLDRQFHEEKRLTTLLNGLVEVGQAMVQTMASSPPERSVEPDPQVMTQAFAAGYATAHGRPDLADVFADALAYCAPEVLVEEAARRWPLFVAKWPREFEEV